MFATVTRTTEKLIGWTLCALNFLHTTIQQTWTKMKRSPAVLCSLSVHVFGIISVGQVT